MENNSPYKKFLSIGGIVLFAFCIRMLRYGPHVPFWDASSYISMGKYLFSGGKVGFVEPFRPVVWPLILGGIWKTGLDPILCGKVLGLIFSIGVITLVYLIGNKVYGKSTGLLAALLLSLSPVYYFWGNCIYADIPGSFLGLLAILLFLQSRPMLSGVLGIVAIFTKFTQFIMVAVIGCTYAFEGIRQRTWSKFLKFCGGCILLAMTFLLVYTAIMHENLWDVIGNMRTIYGQVSFGWMGGIIHCTKLLFTVESLVFIFIPMSLLSLNRDDLDRQKVVILLIGFLLFIWIGKLPTNVARFSIAALPYLYLLSAEGIMQSFRLAKKKVAPRILIAVLCVFAVGIQGYRIATMRFPPKEPSATQRYISENRDNLKGAVIWISDPRILAFSELKAHELMHYPLFNADRIADLRSKLHFADFIFYDGSVLFCLSEDDLTCEKERKALVADINKSFNLKIRYLNVSGEEIGGIFSRKKNSE